MLLSRVAESYDLLKVARSDFAEVIDAVKKVLDEYKIDGFLSIEHNKLLILKIDNTKGVLKNNGLKFFGPRLVFEHRTQPNKILEISDQKTKLIIKKLIDAMKSKKWCKFSTISKNPHFEKYEYMIELQIEN